MKAVKGVKRVQVDGKKYFMPAEDADIEKLIQKGLRLKSKLDTVKSDLEEVENRLIEIARARREGTTTVTLSGVSAESIVTFRESFAVSPDIVNIALPLGPLFDRFFKKDVAYKGTADFKKFMESGHALGLENAEETKKAILDYITVKETKPNVKIQQRKK
ncbi:hypothetical protein [Desulfofustis glycolicus]|uniref:Uncharacterized protein n=1 Tax=Desulfofustis glycolicus DSM 9705 TaxID=1121409 RepID=A0A1M5YUR2_9BACT|nr:hypothetical protein [Desulfofustis glycolicus]SHI15827.1 hypothetical protein SAMN02745124_04481 [Desulfofustis glycolicus DSM 9705]